MDTITVIGRRTSGGRSFWSISALDGGFDFGGYTDPALVNERGRVTHDTYLHGTIHESELDSSVLQTIEINNTAFPSATSSIGYSSTSQVLFYIPIGNGMYEIFGHWLGS